ncbi:MAG: translocation/assembly module TamB domain-containing protein [Pseudomonadota bacterium]
MRKSLLIAAIFTFVMFATLIVVAGVGFRTDSGRSFIKNVISDSLARSIGGDVSIGALTGSLPGEITLKDVVLSDDGEVWASVTMLQARWRPMAIVGGRIVVDEISATTMRLNAPPPDQAISRETTKKPRAPFSLPRIRVNDFSIEDFQSPWLGLEAPLKGSGAAAIGGHDLDMEFDFSTIENRDILKGRIEINEQSNQFDIDVRGVTENDGFVAKLARLTNGGSIILRNDAPRDNAKIQLAANAEGFARAEIGIHGDFKKFSTVDIDAKFKPAERIRNNTAFAEDITAKARLRKTDLNGGALSIEEVRSGLGEIEGEANWEFADSGIRSLSINGKAEPNTDTLDQIHTIAGGPILFSADIDPAGAAYAIRGEIKVPKMSLRLLEGQTDLENTAFAKIEVSAPLLGDLSPLLDGAAALSGDLQLNLEEAVKINSINGQIGDTLTIGGYAAYLFADDQIRGELDLVAGPAFLEKLVSASGAEKAATAKIRVDGPLTDFRVSVDATTPALVINDANVASLTIDADFSGLPDRPSGHLIANSANGESGKLSITVASPSTEKIRINAFEYFHDLFSLVGSGDYARNTETLSMEMSYRGEVGAIPFPGIEINGEAKVAGHVSRTENNNITVNIPRIQSNFGTIENFELQAIGPVDNTNARIMADTIRYEQFELSDIQSTVTIAASNGDNVGVNWNTFSAQLDGERLALTSPAKISIGDAYSVDSISIDGGAYGALQASGFVRTGHWQGFVEGKQLSIPTIDAVIDAEFTLDTEKNTAAVGDITIRSSLSDSDLAQIALNFNWNKEFLNIASAQKSETFDISAKIPAALVHSDSLSIDSSGPISGRVRANGEIASVTPMLPLEAQGIEGEVAADISLAGTMESPILDGKISINDGAYTELQSGLSLVGLNLAATASGNADGGELRLRGGGRGGGQESGETITIDGNVKFGDQNFSMIDLKLDDAVFSANPINTLQSTGEFTLEGPFNALALRGALSIDELDVEIVVPESTGLVPIEVTSRDSTTPRTLAPDSEDEDSRIQFDVDVIADDRVFVRGRGVQSEWSTNISAKSSNSDMLVLGDMTLRNGWLDFSGRRFDLTNGEITFDRLSPNNPILALAAEYETDTDLVARISISGRAAEPRVELTSVPSLPAEDVMAVVLFGKPMAELSAIESLQTAQALASLSGIGLFTGPGVVGALREATGLDLLNVDLDPEQGVGSLTAGKYIADGVFVSATQDAAGKDGSVSIQYELTDNIVVESELQQNGDQTVSANWQRDF